MRIPLLCMLFGHARLEPEYAIECRVIVGVGTRCCTVCRRCDRMFWRDTEGWDPAPDYLTKAPKEWAEVFGPILKTELAGLWSPRAIEILAETMAVEVREAMEEHGFPPKRRVKTLVTDNLRRRAAQKGRKKA